MKNIKLTLLDLLPSRAILAKLIDIGADKCTS